MAKGMPRYQHALVSCARWETESVVEWLNFHLALGFDHAFIFCNDDDPAEFYEAVLPFVESGTVDFFHYPLQGQQEAMFTHFMRHHAHECEWFAFLDMDEFLLLRHQDSIADFLDSFAVPPDAVHFNTLNAGHNGHAVRPNGSVIENFTRRADFVEGFTKCIARRSAFDPGRLDAAFHAAWWHNIAAVLKPGSKNVNVLGDDMTTYYAAQHENWTRMSTPEFHARVIDRGAIYHCGMKSEADMLRRYERGLSGVYSGQAAWKDLHERGRAAVLEYLTPLNAVFEPRLLEMRRRSLAKAYGRQLAPPPIGRNLAPDGVASQSSTSEWSRFPEPTEDAAGLINGRPTGGPNHCTAFENEPWWQVEFDRPIEIREVRVFNRVDSLRDAFRDFTLLVTPDGQDWNTAFEKRDDIPFGGVDGRMFIWRPDPPLTVKALRIRGIGVSRLDLDQVEVY